MSDDLRIEGLGAGPAGVDGRLADPEFLVNADPGEVPLRKPKLSLTSENEVVGVLVAALVGGTWWVKKW